MKTEEIMPTDEEPIKIICGDCLEILRLIPDKSIDLVLTDPPYGITNNDWDIKIDLNKYWNEFLRIGKEDCKFVFTSFQPFTTDLINSNRKMFKFEMIWNKICITSPALAKKQPLRTHENIIIFYKKTGTYNIIPYKKNTIGYFNYNKSNKQHKNWSYKRMASKNIDNEFGYPRSIIEIRRPLNLDKKTAFDCDEKHPTQKPLELFKYLMLMFSNPNNIILDCFLGSGTTAIACKQLGRKCIGIEISKEYYDIAKKRLAQEVLK